MDGHDAIFCCGHNIPFSSDTSSSSKCSNERLRGNRNQNKSLQVRRLLPTLIPNQHSLQIVLRRYVRWRQNSFFFLPFLTKQWFWGQSACTMLMIVFRFLFRVCFCFRKSSSGGSARQYREREGNSGSLWASFCCQKVMMTGVVVVVVVGCFCSAASSGGRRKWGTSMRRTTSFSVCCRFFPCTWRLFVHASFIVASRCCWIHQHFGTTVWHRNKPSICASDFDAKTLRKTALTATVGSCYCYCCCCSSTPCQRTMLEN